MIYIIIANRVDSNVEIDYKKSLKFFKKSQKVIWVTIFKHVLFKSTHIPIIWYKNGNYAIFKSDVSSIKIKKPVFWHTVKSGLQMSHRNVQGEK